MVFCCHGPKLVTCGAPLWVKPEHFHRVSVNIIHFGQYGIPCGLRHQTRYSHIVNSEQEPKAFGRRKALWANDTFRFHWAVAQLWANCQTLSKGSGVNCPEKEDWLRWQPWKNPPITRQRATTRILALAALSWTREGSVISCSGGKMVSKEDSV
jgi:hypothetical protein